MKICYLILAHNNFRHLEMLVKALDDADSSFYIHIDKKVRKNYKPEAENIKIIPERVDINWGGFSMVEATLALMKNGMTGSPDADYYILISGVDYPVRSKSFLHDLLSKNKEYIDIGAVPVSHKPIERYEYYYFDYKRRNAKLYNPFLLAEMLLKRFRIKRKIPFRIYAGTQWFGLTNDCVRYILKTVEEDKRYISFFKHILVPDEAFFHTIIANSPFRNNVASCLTYTDWNVPVPPATITEKHIELLKTHIEFNNEYGKRLPYFARKFNDGSEALLAKIRKELWI